MSSLNKCQFIGHLGRDPETRYLTNGDAVTNISVAITETWRDKATNEKRESTEWVRVTFFRKLAEIAGQYLNKGSLVYVEGKMKTRKFTDKDGVEKYVTEIHGDEMKMLGGRPDGAAPRQNAAPARQPAQQAADFDEDQIPF